MYSIRKKKIHKNSNVAQKYALSMLFTYIFTVIFTMQMKNIQFKKMLQGKLSLRFQSQFPTDERGIYRCRLAPQEYPPPSTSMGSYSSTCSFLIENSSRSRGTVETPSSKTLLLQQRYENPFLLCWYVAMLLLRARNPFNDPCPTRWVLSTCRKVAMGAW